MTTPDATELAKALVRVNEEARRMSARMRLEQASVADNLTRILSAYLPAGYKFVWSGSDDPSSPPGPAPTEHKNPHFGSSGICICECDECGRYDCKCPYGCAGTTAGHRHPDV